MYPCSFGSLQRINVSVSHSRQRGRAGAFDCLAMVSVESAVNTTVTSVPTTSRTAYTDDNQDVEALLAETGAYILPGREGGPEDEK